MNTPQMLVTFAYDDRYDIVARPSAADAAADTKTYSFTDDALDRLHQRVQALLADRFKLVVHSETREMPKGRPHLAEAKGSGPSIQARAGQLTCKKVSMKMFAERTLAQRLGRNVVDKTGVAGDFGPDFLTAMQEELGLKLESQKGPVRMVIIDRAERASAN